MCLFKVGFWIALSSRRASGGDVWSFTKTLPFLGVVCYFSSSTIPVPLSCCFFLPYYAVLRSVHPRSPRAAVRRRLLQQRRPTSTMWEEADSDVRGWEGHPPNPPPPTTTSRVTHDWRCRLMRKVSLKPGACTLENPALDYCPCWWLWWPFLSPAWFSPPSHGRAGCRQNELSALGPESGSSPLPSVGGVLELSSPSRHGRSKGPSYPGRRRTSKSKTVVPQRHEFESRCDSTLPGPSPVLGLATVVRDSPARPCSRWSRHLILAWSRTTVMAHPFPSLIDRSMDYSAAWWYIGAVVCAVRGWCVCDRVSVAG